MIDISQKILKQWEDDGIDIKRIKSKPCNFDLGSLALLDGKFFKFEFEVELVDMQPMRKPGGGFDEFWNKLTGKKHMEIICTVGKMTFRAGLPKDRPDGLGGYNNAKCYIQYLVEIDEDKLTDNQWDAMTKPDFIRTKCGKEGDTIKKKSKKKKKPEPTRNDIMDGSAYIEEIKEEV